MRVLPPIALLLLFSHSPANAGLFEQHPDVIVCSVSDQAPDATWNDLVFYISGLQKDGSTLYKSLTSNPVLLRVGKEGKVDAPKLADCDGKTIETLRKKGRAVNFGS